MLKVGILGVTGYTGAELYRLLLEHPKVKITHCFARQDAGQSLDRVFPQFSGNAIEIETFSDSVLSDLDVLFLAIPHGQSHPLMPTLKQYPVKIVDLSADFRLKDPLEFESVYGEKHESPQFLNDAVLGFTELNRAAIRNTSLVANPGCHSTAAVLGLYPLAKSDALNGPVSVVSQTGVSGAGKSLKLASLFCEAHDSVAAYGTIHHRHVPEIESTLGVQIAFSPILVPMSRGILSVITANTRLSEAELIKLYQDTYQGDYFVHVLGPADRISTRLVRGSNHVFIQVRKHPVTDQAFIFVVIDNLVKGASGQAIQNMNVMVGFEEFIGLTATATYI